MGVDVFFATNLTFNKILGFHKTFDTTFKEGLGEIKIPLFPHSQKGENSSARF